MVTEIITPVVESFELLNIKSGEEIVTNVHIRRLGTKKK